MEIEPKIQNQQKTPNQTNKQPRYKSYWYILLIVINLSLSNFYFGYCLVYISTVEFTDVMQTFKVTMPLQTARGVLTGCIPSGALFGALLGKKLIHVFSRRNYILFINLWGFISGSLLYIQQMESFIIMRIIQGACIGMYTSIIPMTISEISPIQMSGSTGAFTQIFCSIGTTSAYLFYYLLYLGFGKQNQKKIWYYVFGLPLVTLTIQTILLLFVFPYETPKYYLLHHHKNKARQLIAHLYKAQHVQQILHQKMQDIQDGKIKQQKKSDKRISNNKLPPIRIPSKVSINSALSGEQIEQPQTSPVPIFTSIHLMILRQFVGINAVLAYGGSIVKKAVPDLKSIAPIVLTFLTLLGAIMSIYLLARIGRKTIIQCGTFILSVSMLLITIGFFILDSANSAGTGLILTGLFVFMFTFGATLGSTIWLYTAQICQPSYIILATAITWIFASIVIVFFPILKNYLPNQNPVYLFLFFFIWTTISFVLNQKVLIETKGKTQHEIHQQYKNLKLFGMGGVMPIQSVKKQQHKEMSKKVQDNINQQESSGVMFVNKNELENSKTQVK